MASHSASALIGRVTYFCFTRALDARLFTPHFVFHCALHVSLCFVPQRGLVIAPSAARTVPMHPLWTSGPGGAVDACRYMMYICHTAGALTRQGCGRSPVCSAHGKRWRMLVERFTHCLIQCLTRTLCHLSGSEAALRSVGSWNWFPDRVVELRRGSPSRSFTTAR